jgi:hypothetical protein
MLGRPYKAAKLQNLLFAAKRGRRCKKNIFDFFVSVVDKKLLQRLQKSFL